MQKQLAKFWHNKRNSSKVHLITQLQQLYLIKNKSQKFRIVKAGSPQYLFYAVTELNVEKDRYTLIEQSAYCVLFNNYGSY